MTSYSDGGIGSVIAVNLVIGVPIFVVFLVLQQRQTTAPVYRGRDGSDDQMPPPPRGLAWFAYAWRLFRGESWEVMMRRAGFKSVMYLRFQRFACLLATLLTVLCTCVLLPINTLGTYNREIAEEQNKAYVSGFDDWTSTNLGTNDSKYWAHLAVFVLISVCCYYFLHQLLLDFHELRKIYREQRSDRSSVAAHTVLISHLPLALRDASVLETHINNKFLKDSVLEVVLVMDAPAANLAYARRVATKQQLRDVMNKWTFSQRQAAEGAIPEAIRPMVATGCLAALGCGPKVDQIEQLKEQLVALDVVLAEQRGRADFPVTGRAFVTFKSTRHALAFLQNASFKFDGTRLDGTCSAVYRRSNVAGFASKLLKSQHARYDGQAAPLPVTPWTVKPAPLAKDLMWNSMHMTATDRRPRQLLYSVGFWWLVVFWAIPVASLNLAGLYLADQLSLPPYFSGFLTAYLPTIVTLAFNIILPIFLRFCISQQGELAASAIEKRVMGDMTTFTIFSVVILPSVLIGSLSSLYSIIDEFSTNPVGVALNIISKVTSPQTGFFISLLIQSSLMGCALALLRVGPYLNWTVRTKIASTPADKEAANAQLPFLFYLEYPKMLLMLTLVLWFSVTMPIITPLGLMYFCCKTFTDRYNIAYVHPYPDETGKGGELFAVALGRTMMIFIAFQAVTWATFVGKECLIQAGICLVFIIFSVIFRARLNARMARVFKQDLWVPELDQDHDHDQHKDAQALSLHTYQMPGLRDPADDAGLKELSGLKAPAPAPASKGQGVQKEEVKSDSDVDTQEGVHSGAPLKD